MENNYQGDLGDIFRASGVNSSGDLSDWQFQSDVHVTQQPQIQTNGFGQPFSCLLDPLLQDQLDMPAVDPSLFRETDNQSQNNIFSKMLHISPNDAKSTLSSSKNRITSSSKSCLLQSTSSLQISSPPNTAIKRRKTQAKKVVCIPAPAPANSRPTGEVVPSDLWAWRKYGQKPIKGSPYPRGYYRCSSSKGCSARKQVERSRTDPNMLVITYTSEHNHPWPTQRNALAGSTRPQLPSKTSSTSTSAKPPPPPKDTGGTTAVKDEILEQHDKGLGTYPQSYRPELPDASQPEDFFGNLGEIEADPISLLLNQGFLGGDEEGEDYNKDMDEFLGFDWKSQQQK